MPASGVTGLVAVAGAPPSNLSEYASFDDLEAVSRAAPEPASALLLLGGVGLAAVVRVTGPDGKDFRLAFDKESGLPV